MKNYLTYAQLDFKALHIAKIGPNEINPSVRQAIVNDFVYKLYGLLDGVNHPFWNRTVTLTVSADQEHLLDAVTNGGIITAIDSTAKTVTRSSGSFPAGAILDVVIVNKSNGTIVGQWKARVTVSGATCTYSKIGSGTEATFSSASHMAAINVMKKLSVTSASLASQYVKKVVKVFDDQGPGNKERVFDTIQDTQIFGTLHSDPFQPKRVAWYQNGDQIDFAVGASASALGIVQAEIVAKPTLFTDDTLNNELDIPPEENQMISDEVVAEYAKIAKKDVPTDVNARLALYEKRYAAAAADKAQALDLQGKRS